MHDALDLPLSQHGEEIAVIEGATILVACGIAVVDLMFAATDRLETPRNDCF